MVAFLQDIKQMLFPVQIFWRFLEDNGKVSTVKSTHDLSNFSDSSTSRFFKYKYDIIHEGLNLCIHRRKTLDKWFGGVPDGPQGCKAWLNG